MSWRWGGVLAALVLAFAAPAAAERCTASTPWGVVEYDCSATEETPPEETPWWADDTAQAIVGIVGLGASAGAGAYTYHRIRRKRRLLGELIQEVERTFVAAKAAPAEGATRLAQLRHDVRARHARGLLDDTQFLELDGRIARYTARLRLLDLEQRFPGLPDAFLHETRARLEDGVVSEADAHQLERAAFAHGLPFALRNEVVTLVHAWAVEDGGEPAAPPVA